VGQGVNKDQHQVVFTFAVPITLSGSPTVSVLAPGGGTPGASASVSGSVVTVNLTGIVNAQMITITLTNVNGAGPVSVPMGVLLGDTSANRLVNATDTSQTQAQSGKAVTVSNFRTDVNVNGLINSTDTSIVQSKSGTGF
jgi:hypothetical protein